ncbi:hypothetical protein SAY86_001141 [Trapa natans]|uniref:Uncharacterized protein n=1 Tax=Trapa natans TaxID=22666 RepID=A0AAN7RNL7_TRANT|nr:hypothetical protein SAY86_001141 [Trapa natans]
MASSKVHCISEPAAVAPGEATCYYPLCPSSLKRESFTVWMKSLIMHSNGCTVFNEDGDVVYRMDNYDTRRSKKVHLMDLRGRVIFTIVKRKLGVFGFWDGYKSEDSALSPCSERAGFRVRRDCSFLKRSFLCKVAVFCSEAQRTCYTIEGLVNKPEFSIKNSAGNIVAEFRRKQTASGVYLGEDVMALVVEPQVDRSLAVALVAVYASICHRI